MNVPELLLQLFVKIGTDGQVRCRKNTTTFEDALALKAKGLVTIQTGTRVDTAYICLSDNGINLFNEIQKLFLEKV
jgi:hypothetical protein